MGNWPAANGPAQPRRHAKPGELGLERAGGASSRDWRPSLPEDGGRTPVHTAIVVAQAILTVFAVFVAAWWLLRPAPAPARTAVRAAATVAAGSVAAPTATPGDVRPAWGSEPAPIEAVLYIVDDPRVAEQLQAQLSADDTTRSLLGLPPANDRVLLVTNDEEADALIANIVEGNRLLEGVVHPLRVIDTRED